MARYCPMKQGPALYLDCKECDERECEKETVGSSTVPVKNDDKDIDKSEDKGR